MQRLSRQFTCPKRASRVVWPSVSSSTLPAVLGRRYTGSGRPGGKGVTGQHSKPGLDSLAALLKGKSGIYLDNKVEQAEEQAEEGNDPSTSRIHSKGR